MIKKFFISMLGTIAGVWISLFIALIAGVIVVGAIVASDGGSGTSEVKKNSVLYLDLSGTMPERFQPADIWQLLQGAEEDGESLNNTLAAIRGAANDSKIEGIYINADGMLAGFATREEIVDALRDFKESGKWIYAYADSYGQGDYMLASLADSIWLNPLGSVGVQGVGMQVPFYKGLLDKIGVRMQVLRVGTFKSAVEPYINTDMSEPARFQNQVMVDSLWNYYTATVADARGITQQAVNQWADTLLSSRRAQAALAAGAVTSLKYRHGAEDVLRDMLGLDSDDEINLVSPSTYVASLPAVNKDKDHIAVLYACGDIVDSGDGGIVGATMTPEIYRLADDDNVRALLLRVNSGGGSAFASEQIWEALEYFKSQGKPFYVSMGDYAASGGYYISCGADRIFADHCTLTGSIGVFGLIPDFSGLATDKLGVNFATVQSTTNGTFPSVLTGLTPYQLDAMQKSVEDMYDTFTMRVADGRSISQDSVKVIAEGRVWTGGAALDLGLVDEIGGINVALNALADEAGIDAEKVVEYPAVEDKFLAALLADARKNVSLGGLDLDARTLRLLQFLDRLQAIEPVQARMPMVFFE